MDCQQFQNQWVEAEEGALSPQEKREWDLHRQSCAECQKEGEALESLQSQLRGIPPASPLPPVFWSRQADSIMKKIESAPQRRFSRWWESLFQPHFAFIAVALTLLIFFGTRYFRPQGILQGPQEHWAFHSEEPSSDLDLWGSEEGSEWDLTEEQVDQYYATLAQKYLPTTDQDDEGEDKIWVDDLDEKQLGEAIKIFEQKTERRAL